MQVALSYGLPSGVEWGSQAARVRLAGAMERPKLSYRGAVKEPLALRELLGALYDVVIADFRWRPSVQREEFQRWLTAKLGTPLVDVVVFKELLAHLRQLPSRILVHARVVQTNERDCGREVLVCGQVGQELLAEVSSRWAGTSCTVGED